MTVPDLRELIKGVEDEAGSDDPLVRLAVAVRRRSELDEVAEAVLDHFVEQAKGSGCSWTQIGAELGVTKQAAQQRHSHDQSVARRLLARVRPRDRSGGGLFGGRFDSVARQAVAAAQNEARTLGHGYIGTEHLLLGLLKVEDSGAARTLASVAIDYPAAWSQVVAAFGQDESAQAGNLPFTPRTKKVLELSLQESLRLKHNRIGTEHLLLGLASESDGGAIAVLRAMGVDGDALRAAVMDGFEDPQPKDDP